MSAGLSRKQITSRIYNRLQRIAHELAAAGISTTYKRGGTLVFNNTDSKIDGGFNITYYVSHASNGECFGVPTIYVVLKGETKTFGRYEDKSNTYEKGIEFIKANFKPAVEDDTLQCSGVCKDCGNGTLNNKLNPAFDFNGNGVYCLNCGSFHVDVI